MNQGVLAERYARAIFELGLESNRLSELTEQVLRFATTYAGSPALRAVLTNPVLAQDKRSEILRQIATRLGISGYALNALLLLMRRRRMSAVLEISRALVRMSDDKLGVFRVMVTSAAPLPGDYLQKLNNLFAKATGKQIKLEASVDPGLIGGIVTRLGDRTIDGSVRGRLAKMSQQLLGTLK